jgi:hypothetical protein
MPSSAAQLPHPPPPPPPPGAFPAKIIFISSLLRTSLMPLKFITPVFIFLNLNGLIETINLFYLPVGYKPFKTPVLAKQFLLVINGQFATDSYFY